MDMGLTEVQQMLKSSAQEFLAQECPLTLVREMEGEPRAYNDSLWQQIVELGWTGLVFPEEYGGAGGNFMDLSVLLEEMGRALLPGPFFSTVVLGGLTVLDAGSDGQKRDLLNRIAGGQLLVTLAITEPSATYEPWGIETAAMRSGDGFVLNGTKLFVPDAEAADIFLVAARTSTGSDQSEGITLFLVPANAGGLSVHPLRTIADDHQCEVALEQVSVGSGSVLGQVDEGWPVIERALQRATAGKCMEMLGGSEAVLDMTVEYVKQRTQFGRPVGSFQAIQHECSEMATDVEGSRTVAYQAAWKVSEGANARREVSVAKAWTSEAYQRVCARAHQCHGAIGFTKEHDLQLYTRRAKVQELSYGDAHFHKELALGHLEAFAR